MAKELRLLLLHGVKTWKPGFESVINQEFSFPRYDAANSYVSQSWYLPVSSFVKQTAFDAVIVTSSFMDAVVRVHAKSAWYQQYEFLKSSRHVKIAFPQDDYWFVEERDAFYTNHEFDAVFPVCPEPSWNELLPRFSSSGGLIFQGQTAFVTPKILSLRNWVKNFDDRDFDVVYRASRFPKVPNQIGDLKGELGSLFLRALGPSEGLRIDLGIERSNFLRGPGWYGFLANSRATLGSNSGSSVLLRNKEMFRKALKSVEDNPEMSRRELETIIFPAKDRGKDYTTLSPRNLEAAALGVLQLLTPGNYGGLMKRGVDYFELEKDCSNASDVANLVRDTQRSTSITDRAYSTLIEDPTLSFGSHVIAVNELIRQHMRPRSVSQHDSEKSFLARRSIHRRCQIFLTNVAVVFDYSWTALALLKRNLGKFARVVRAPSIALRGFYRLRRNPR